MSNSVIVPLERAEGWLGPDRRWVKAYKLENEREQTGDGSHRGQRPTRAWAWGSGR